MRNYFTGEMQLLKELAQEFAQAHPDQAKMLNMHALSDRDPYIERLLEGVAFLTAQIRQKIDDDIPGVCQTLLEQIAPQLIRPYPSMTIMQFSAKQGLQYTLTIPKHSVLTVEQKNSKTYPCRFRTTAEINVNPLQIIAAEFKEYDLGGTTIKIYFAAENAIKISKLNLADLPLYLHAEPAIAADLYWALVDGVESVDVHVNDESIVSKSEVSVEASGFSVDDALVPFEYRSFYGFHLLRDYFCFQANCWFICIKGLEKLHFNNTNEFSLIINMRMRLGREYRLNKNNFRLHCIPAVNLFQTTSEPIFINHDGIEYPLVVDAQHKEEVQLYAVTQVTGKAFHNNKQRLYHSYYEFKHREEDSSYCCITQRDIGENIQVHYINVSNMNVSQVETLSCEVLATNGQLPRRLLNENSILHASGSIAEQVEVTNIMRPTAMHYPSKKQNFRRELLAHLSLNQQVFSDVAQFKSLLFMYDWSGCVENKRRIEGLQELIVKSLTKVNKGMLFNGLEFYFQVLEKNYSSLGDIYMFGKVLHQFISMFVSFNVFVVTRMQCFPSENNFLYEN